ncbi:hypothetical protein [Amycolatopsis taiwanensis]|nr:hypothetical protein [Amycolatopsis taiwanensis]
MKKTAAAIALALAAAYWILRLRAADEGVQWMQQQRAAHDPLHRK